MVFGCKSVPFDPEKDIPPLNGKVILVTGGNIGLGKQCVLEYARHRPALIWLAARNVDKAQAAVDEIRQQVPNTPPIKVLSMDLLSLDSVVQAARTVITESDCLDILMLNAGVMAAPPGLTQNGYELQFGTNYLGHALLVKLLLPLLERTVGSDRDTSGPPQDVRIVEVSSHALIYARKVGVLFDLLRKPARCPATGKGGQMGLYLS